MALTSQACFPEFNYEWNLFAQRYDPHDLPTWGLKPYIAFRWRGSTVPGNNPSGGQPNPPPTNYLLENPNLGTLKECIRNNTCLPLRIKNTRFSNTDPVAFSADFAPGTQIDVDYFGGSNQVFAAWKVSNGQLVCSVPIGIFANTAIVFYEPGGGAQISQAVKTR